jgi:tetratricopeptide (TPR) repeat protein
VLSPGQILERLGTRLDLLRGGRDAEARQATLRATIEWSHDLLNEDERVLFARLAVFRGGCTLEAAESVADAGIDVVQSLVDKSLLRSRDDRFWMLETIRGFAVERLERSEEADVLRRRHARYFLALAEEADPHLRGDPEAWLIRLEREHDNLRAALDRLEASGETELVLQLAGSLQRFWYLHGHLAEGRRRLDAALAADQRPTRARAKALSGSSLLALDGGDLAAMKRRSQEALSLHGELGDAWGAAVAGFQLAHATTHGGDPEAGLRLFEESVRRFRELGDEHYTLVATHGLAFTHYALGDLERSRELHEEELSLAQRTSNRRIEARALAQLGVIAVDQGRIQEAMSILDQAYRIDREVGEIVQATLDLCRFAHALAASGRAADAARVLSRAEASRKEIGATFLPWAMAMNERTSKVVRAHIGDDGFGVAWEDGRAMTMDDAAALALARSE